MYLLSAFSLHSNLLTFIQQGGILVLYWLNRGRSFQWKIVRLDHEGQTMQDIVHCGRIEV